MFQDQKNSADPLAAAKLPDQGETLFKSFAAAASGHGFDAVLSAASNMLINVIRQQYDKAGDAEDALDTLHARTKQMLLDFHYRPGRFGLRKQGSFAFAQHIIVPKVI